jgi:tRNA G18 (ribose-2'-O)-methylase SpoU
MKSKSKFGLIVGNESKGISPFLKELNKGSAKIKTDTASRVPTYCHIPGYGKSESLNVAIATGILLYELTNK